MELVLFLLLAFSITFVSAGWFSDLFKKDIQFSPSTQLVEGQTYTIHEIKFKGARILEVNGDFACFKYSGENYCAQEGEVVDLEGTFISFEKVRNGLFGIGRVKLKVLGPGDLPEEGVSDYTWKIEGGD